MIQQIRDSLFGSFGVNDPRKVPLHLFRDSLHLDYASAVKGDVSKQNFSVCPRYWYIDATFRCVRCGESFCFTTHEQRVWYEEYAFWVDSCPKRCLNCRSDLRKIVELRKVYDRQIADALSSDDCELKMRLAEIVDELCEASNELPDKIHDNRRALAKQIDRHRGSSSV